MGANLSKALGAFPPSTGVHSHGSHLGLVVPALSGRLFGNKEMRLLMLGLDAAGKTSEEPLMKLSFSPSSASWIMLIRTRQRSYTSSS